MVRKRKRKSPTDEDIERWIELLYSPDVVDAETFDKSWRDFFADEKHIRDNKELEMKTFRRFKEVYPETKTGIIPKRKIPVKPRKEYTTIGRTKGRIVRTRMTYVIVKGKQQVRHRDRYGRFASVKKK